MALPETYGTYTKLAKEVRLLGGVSAVLAWDQETNMPKKGTPVRADELAMMSGLRHERFTSDAMGETLAALEGQTDALGEKERANVRETRRVFDRARKLPKDFVEELTRTCSVAHEAWIEARKASEWSTFAPHLEKILGLKRREAELVGYEGGEAYDALLDEYEPGMRAERCAAILGGLRDEVVALVQAIAEKERPEDIAGTFPREGQERFGKKIIQAMGFDLDAGRVDVSAHPFCSGFHPGDVRLTTRYDEANPRQALFGLIHEAGHGLYEQGLDPSQYGTPMGEACSTAMHESQSRLWENVIGRSLPFWERFFPELKEVFPDALRDVDLARWHRYVNDVRPSLIRVEADEVTYNLHILLRFEIERALFKGELEVGDLPGVWNEKMQAYLGLTPPSDADGVLQDVHWSFGGFGYFPTYSLGNLYGAQIVERAQQDLPELWDQVRRGDLLPLKAWLNANVHRKGCLFPPDRFIEDLTGSPPSAEPFVRYLKEKFGAIYGL